MHRRRRKRRKRKAVHWRFLIIVEKKTGADQEVLKRHPLPYDFKNVISTRLQDNSFLRNLGSWSESPWKQTHPPTIGINSQFPDAKWPVGDIQEYKGENAYRNNNPEMLTRDTLLFEDKIASLRKAAEVHRQVRKYAQSIAKPGIKLVDLCTNLESVLRYLMFLTKEIFLTQMVWREDKLSQQDAL